jgi:type II secretory pathway pseudopilin PulG
LIELVVVLAILGILIALAVPRFLAARKKAYKAEADNILQEAKTLEWAYYQQG